MKWTKDTDEFKMFADFYELTKKWYGGINEKEKYNSFWDEVDAFYKKYKDLSCSMLAYELGKALANYIDKKYYKESEK